MAFSETVREYLPAINRNNAVRTATTLGIAFALSHCGYQPEPGGGLDLRKTPTPVSTPVIYIPGT